MLGKASEIKISDPLSGVRSARGWLIEHPAAIVLNIQTTAGGERDYFYITYKEEAQ